jgi:hypothetical protein
MREMEHSFGGMIIYGKTELLGEKPAPMPFCSPQISGGQPSD